MHAERANRGRPRLTYSPGLKTGDSFCGISKESSQILNRFSCSGCLDVLDGDSHPLFVLAGFLLLSLAAALQLLE